MDWLSSIVSIIVGVIIVALFLCIEDRSLVGGTTAKITDVIWIVVLGTIINAVLGAFVPGVLGIIVTLIVWVALIKHFFDASWGKALLIGIIAIVVLVIILVILAALGFAALFGLGALGL